MTERKREYRKRRLQLKEKEKSRIIKLKEKREKKKLKESHFREKGAFMLNEKFRNDENESNLVW